MGKPVTDATVDRNLREAAQAGVGVRLLCMVGYPGDDDAATQDTIRRNVGSLSGLSITPFQRRSGSPMVSDAAQVRLDGVVPHADDAGNLRRAEALRAWAAAEVLPTLDRPWGPFESHGWVRS